MTSVCSLSTSDNAIALLLVPRSMPRLNRWSMEKRHFVAAEDDYEDRDNCAGGSAGDHPSSTSAGAIAGGRPALIPMRRGSFTHSALHP